MPTNMAELCQAIKNIDSRQVNILLQRGCSANYVCPDGICPLHLACGLEENDDSVEIVKSLIENGADINYPTFDGLTPVHVAAIWGRSLTLAALVESGGNAYLKDNEEMTAVEYAYQSGENAMACLCILEGYGFSLKGVQNADMDVTTSELENLNTSISSSESESQEETLQNTTSFSFVDELFLDDINSKLKLTPFDEKPPFPGNTSKKGSYSSGYSADISQTRSSSVSSCDEQEEQAKFSICSPEISTNTATPVKSNSWLLTPSKGRSNYVPREEKESPIKRQFECKYGCVCDTCCKESDIVTYSPKRIPNDRKVSSPIVAKQSHTLNYKDKSHIDSKITHSSLKSHELDHSFFEISVAYDWKDLSVVESSFDSTVMVSDDLQLLTDREIREKLRSYGETPGPITSTTRSIYIRHLTKLQEGRQRINPLPRFDEYPPEIRSILSGGGTIEDGADIEREMCLEFIYPEKHKWREGTRKTSFNYLLLDPRVTKDIPSRIKQMSSLEQFRAFVSAIFYIGKGKQARPIEHLYETIKARQAQSKRVSDKIRVIEEIWSSGFGVLSLNVFHNIIPVEAFTREACMVDALGLQRLTNVNRGNYYGPATCWTLKKKRQLGTYLLQKALKVFIAEGEHQIREHDLEK